MSLSRVIAGIVFATLTTVTYASGGGGYGSTPTSVQSVDQAYEVGKSVYRGKAPGLKKIKYCVDNGTEKVKVKRKNLKSFKNGKARDLAAALYDCDNPDTKIHQILSNADISSVMYYLNKRFRLKLRGV